MVAKSRYRTLVVKSKDWLRAKRSAVEKELIGILSNSEAVKIVEVAKDKRHPEKWGVAAIIDVGDDSAKDVLDKVAKELGYSDGVFSKKFMRKHIKEDCLYKMIR
jgi:hypothetical protein